MNSEKRLICYHGYGGRGLLPPYEKFVVPNQRSDGEPLKVLLLPGRVSVLYGAGLIIAPPAPPSATPLPV